MDMNLGEGVEASLESEAANSVAVPQVQGGLGAALEPQDEAARAQRLRRERLFEVASAIALAVVAVATAWSGYQATRWTDAQSARYAQASAQRVQATRDATLAGQYRLYDLVLVNTG
jgi:type VI protein secretion system component VasF